MASTGFDTADNATAKVPLTHRNIDYAASLTTGTLKGLRLGVLEGFFNRTDSFETMPVNLAMDNAMSRLKAEGVIIVPIEETIYNAAAIRTSLDVQRFEYRELMDEYLQRSSLGGGHPSTLAELYSHNARSGYGGKFLVLPSQNEFVSGALVSSTSNATYFQRQDGIATLKSTLLDTFTNHKLDAIIYPQQMNLVVKISAPSQSGRNGILAALTGSPAVTVPVGFSEPSDETPWGVPIGMEILGRAWEEEKLLGIGYKVEQLLDARKAPSWAQELTEVREYESVPVVRPDWGNISGVYPLGTL